MQIRCIGCAGGYPLGDNGTTSFLISDSQNNYHLLLDAGSGSAMAIENYLDVNQLDAIWISHDHPDHVADLGIFQHLFFLKKPEPKIKPIPIYMHPNSVQAPLLMKDAFSEVVFYHPDQSLKLGPFMAEFIRTTHPVECYAIRLTETATRKVLVFMADSGAQTSLIDFCKRADVLIADCNFPNEYGTNVLHHTAGEVAQLSNQAAVKHLVASHIPPQADYATILCQITQELDPAIQLTHCLPGTLISI